MSRPARIVGIIVFVLVEVAVLFASYVVGSVRCCTGGPAAWPTGAAEWVSLAIFAVVMVIPAALIAMGAAMIVDGVRHAVAALTRRDRPSNEG